MRAGALSTLAVVAIACGTPAAPGKLELRAAADGEVAPLIARELAEARREGKQVLVYVGATWCEPCRRFHEAAKAGELDRVFPKLRLVEFDADRDNPRLARAGYVSKLIPLFVRPGDDGRSSGRQIEGSVKGDGAVAQIAPRLQQLLSP